MTYPFIIERSDKCSVCKKDRSLELYNVYDKPLYLSDAIDNSTTKSLVRMNARYFQCKNCGLQFPILWVGENPIPLELSTYDLFFESYKKYKK